jgi:hypothetical protein
MEQYDIILSLAISIIFSLLKIADYKFIIKEEVDIKKIIRDSVLVFISAVASQFIMKQVNLTGETKSVANAFVNVPDF